MHVVNSLFLSPHYEGTKNERSHVMGEIRNDNGLRHTHDELWSWLAVTKNHKMLKMICERAANRHNLPFDDVYELALDRLIKYGPSWFWKYSPTHPSKASLSTYILSNVEFQLRRYPKNFRPMNCVDDLLLENVLYSNSGDDRQALVDGIADILKCLNHYERFLIVARHLHGLNFTEIADALGVAKGTTRLHYLKAIAKAKHFANL